jgi:hypothetical protein
MSGVGQQSGGTSSSGFGDSAEATARGGSFLRDTLTGKSLGTRLINPATKDYVMDDDNGRILGQHYVQHAVQMSIATVQGSAADTEMGHRLASLDRISPNFARQVEALLTEALKPLTDRGLVEVKGFVQATVGLGGNINGLERGAIYGRLLWKDLTTGLEHKEAF